jgi:hypothetical protein
MNTRSIIITIGVAAFLLFVIASAVKDIPDLINFYNNGKIASGQFIIQAAYGMYEDQLEVCNFESVCQVVNIDDYMTKNASDKLQYNFNNDLDTYSKIQALDEECRDNYHAFCFGEAWSSLRSFLN